MFIMFKIAYSTYDGTYGLWLHRSPDLQRTASHIRVSHHLLSKSFVSFCDVGVVAFPLIESWTLDSSSLIARKNCFIAKSSSFQEGVPFIPFFQWFYDSKACRPTLTQWFELVQIMTFSITVSSLELVNSGAMFPANSSVFEITAPPPLQGFHSFV
jgi:hypothetical protein